MEAHGDRPEDTAVLITGWIATWVWIPGIALGGAFLPLLFPDGDLPSPRWRPVVWLVISGMVIGVVSGAFLPGPLDSRFPDLVNPFGLDGLGGLLDAGVVLAGVIIVGGFICGAAAQVVRFRAAVGERREQLKWFAFFGCVAGIGIFSAFLSTLIPNSPYSVPMGDLGWFAAVLSLGIGLPIAIAFAITRYRLYDIDWIINRTLVYVPLTALLAGVYIALTGVFRAVLTENTGGNSDAAVAFSTIAVVAALTPAKNYLQERVDKRFKENSDPARELDDLARQARGLAESMDHNLFLQRYLSRLASSLSATGARLELSTAMGPLSLAQGEAEPSALTLGVPVQGDYAGELHLGPRRGGRPYTQAEIAAVRRSLDALALLVERAAWPVEAGSGR
jgi:hypothetical protein